MWLNVTCLIFIFFVCVTWFCDCFVAWLLCVRLDFEFAWHDLFTRVTWLMAYLHVWQDSFIPDMLPFDAAWLLCMCVTWHMRAWHDSSMCNMTLLYQWQDYFVVDVTTFLCVTWRIRMCYMTPSYVWHDLYICVTWLIHMCDTALSHVWRNSFMCVAWLIHMCDMTIHIYVAVWRDPFLCASRLISLCTMTHFSVWRNWFIHICIFICWWRDTPHS